ncbi:STAS domain-containing protein [Heliobacterium gestii]|uniref:STAS domain-containing protein n=1 Tax=Heliomicrobium gestii TaxID=2699 RepID=A0A845LHU8_HELGE|nr:STAS domain-containing protein [Heliomicrobium gestii]MBM7868356.1 rsbT co-antagonist protein RsbR [Heliomicrobium gestii]MZP42436.1 STAS domain-containing protein [Heliomicrobium gestii]
MPTRITHLLMERKDNLLQIWMEGQLSELSLRLDRMTSQDLYRQSKEFVDAFVRAIAAGNVEDISRGEWEPIRRMLAQISVTRTHQGFSPTETANYVFSLKEALIRLVQGEVNSQMDIFVQEFLPLSRTLDKLGLLTFESYTRAREEIISRQQQEMLELSTPVIRVWDGILALPLIGTLDSGRTQVIMENLLRGIQETNSDVAILDISGVPTVDTLVAQHIMKTVSAARLMGAECIISGIRPEIAQTIVQLGVDLSMVKTRASLAGALRLAYEMRRLIVVPAK